MSYAGARPSVGPELETRGRNDSGQSWQGRNGFCCEMFTNQQIRPALRACGIVGTGKLHQYVSWRAMEGAQRRELWKFAATAVQRVHISDLISARTVPALTVK